MLYYFISINIYWSNIGLLTIFRLKSRRAQSCRVYNKMMPNVGVSRARLRDIILLLLLSARHLLYTAILILFYTSTRRLPHTHVFKTFTHIQYTRVYTIWYRQLWVVTLSLGSRHFHPFCCWCTLYYIIHTHTHTHTHMRARYPLYAQIK